MLRMAFCRICQHKAGAFSNGRKQSTEDGINSDKRMLQWFYQTNQLLTRHSPWRRNKGMSFDYLKSFTISANGLSNPNSIKAYSTWIQFCHWHIYMFNMYFISYYGLVYLSVVKFMKNASITQSKPKCYSTLILKQNKIIFHVLWPSTLMSIHFWPIVP